jgi:hypothetical protein
MPAPELHAAPSQWKVVAAKAVGTSHQAIGLPCQDALAWCWLPSGLLAIALADGAGSAPMAETGANLAVDQALKSLQDSPANLTPEETEAWGSAIRVAFQAARWALQEEALAASLPPSAFATTLICLVAASDGLVLGQVGDGAVVARTPLGDLYTLTQPQRGEFANETLFITMPEAIEQGFFQAVALDLAGLAVMSDGIIRLALQLPGYAPHAPFFSPLWSFAGKPGAGDQVGTGLNTVLAEFLASERVCARTDDDKSLLIAVRGDPDLLQPLSKAYGGVDPMLSANPTQSNTEVEG